MKRIHRYSAEHIKPKLGIEHLVILSGVILLSVCVSLMLWLSIVGTIGVVRQ